MKEYQTVHLYLDYQSLQSSTNANNIIIKSNQQITSFS